MKKTVITAVLTVLLALPATAATEKNKGDGAPFARQIEFLLLQDNPDIDVANLRASILFTFDSENRIRVIEVACEDEHLVAYVREKLDGRKVFWAEPLEGQRFVLPVRIAS